MKRIIVFILFSFGVVFSQQINSIRVPGLSSPTLAQAQNEFNYMYTNECNLTWTAQDISQYFRYPTINWPLPMLAWSNLPGVPLNVSDPKWPKWTAEAVIAFAKAYRNETDATRRANYKTKAQSGAEFLLWLMSSCQSNANEAGLPDIMPFDAFPSPNTDQGVFTTGMAGMAFYECFLSFGDQKYKEALIKTAEWQYSHPSYPHNFSPTDPFRYYSNVNMHSRPLEHLCDAYRITGNQKYLNRAIQLAEEIIAWQDYRDLQKDPWGPSSIPDGSWYHYDYSAPTNQLPPNEDINTSSNQGWDPERKMDYHCLTLDGLIALLDCTTQQILPGTTTIRNNVSFATFHTNLINAIIKGMNYIINNQETVDDPPSTRYRGLIISCKNYLFYDGQPTPVNCIRSGPHGLSTIVNGYLALLKSNKLSTQDKDYLEKLVNEVSTVLIGKYSWGWPLSVTRVTTLRAWADYMNYKNLPTPSPVLSLVNPGFEDKIIAWELWSWDGGGVTVDAIVSRSGSNSVHLVDNNGNASKWASLLVSVTPNTTYKAEAYARIISNYQAIYIHYYDANYNLVDFNYALIYSNSSFQYVSVLRQAPSNAIYARITLYADWYGTSEGYWDDVLFSAISPKTSPQTSFNEMPVEYSLSNYPNPFNPLTKIQYSLEYPNDTKLRVYDITGKEVANLVNGFQEKGKHEINFDASKLSSGVYFYSIESGEFVQTKKMMLIK